MVKSALRIALILCFGFANSFAQPPIIQSISRTSGGLNDEIYINGSNFSNNPTDFFLYFGGVKGIIKSSTLNSIKAQIPGNAITGNIVLIKRNNGLQGASRSIFFNSFSGSGFDPARISAEFNFPEAAELYDLTLCDFNNDKKLDVAVTKNKNGSDISIFKNNCIPGSINFLKYDKFTNPELNLSSLTSNIAFGDIDGDGLPDIIVTKSGSPGNVVFVLRNISSSGSIKFDAALSYSLPAGARALNVRARDIDNDGKPEIIITNSLSNTVSIFKNQSTIGIISFNTSPYLLSMNGAASTGGLVVDDLNDDGYPDIITNTNRGANLFVAVNKSIPGNISFNSSQSIPLSGDLNNVTCGDYNGDGKIDIALTKTNQNQAEVLINTTSTANNTIAFAAPLSASTDPGPWGLSTSDVDGNGKPDIVLGVNSSRHINILLNSNTPGVASFTKIQLPTNDFTRNIQAADLDGDSKPDFIYTSFDSASSTYNLSVIRNLNCFVPSITPSVSQVLCTNDTIHLYSNQGYNINYQWNRNSSIVKFNTQNFLDVLQAGSYKVYAVNADSSCIKVSNLVTVNTGSGNTPATPAISGTTQYCIGDNLSLSTPSVTGAVYSWSGPNGFVSSSRNINISNLTPSESGIYTLNENVAGCASDPDTAVVGVDVLPDFMVSTTDPTSFCIGNTVRLQTMNLNGYNYQWFKDNFAASGATSATYNADEDGSFSVQVTSMLSSCRTVSKNAITLTSIIHPSAIYTIGGGLCIGVDLTITNNSTYEITQPVSFLWTFGDGSPSSTATNVTHSYTNAGNYHLSLVLKYTNGACQDSLTQVLTIHNNPVCSISENPTTTLCEGVQKTLTVDQTFNDYLWDDGSPNQSTTVFATGDYSVTVTDANACQDTCSINVLFSPQPVVTATADKLEVDPGTKVHLQASGALTYVWSNENLLDNNLSATPVATIFDSTEFVVIGANSEGCTDTAYIFISIPPGNFLNVKPAKLFSPNGDGIDDAWKVENIENYPECRISIYNAEGAMVYQSKPYNNDWQAIFNGRNLPQGTYFYIIDCPDKERKTGSITLIR